MNRILAATTLLTVVLAPSVQAQTSGGPTVEYIAHAAVVIESSIGTRVLIDPYNGDMWMGYRFPEGLEADAVLVTHPHYDHDAAWYFDASVPVFREANHATVGDIRLTGVASEHSGGARFRRRGAEPYNTIWVVEADGVRFAHLGDNRLPTEEDLAAMGEVDVWFVTPFTAAAEVRELAARAGVSLVVPVHHRLAELAAPTYGLPTAEEWLVGEPAVRRAEGHRVELSESAMPVSPAFQVIAAHPDVTGWTPELMRAWGLEAESRSRLEADDPLGAIGLLEDAISLAPTVINLHLALGRALLVNGQEVDARAALERGLVHAGRGDVEQTMRTRALLGRLYAAEGRADLAETHYRLVVRERWSYAADALEEARAFLRNRFE